MSAAIAGLGLTDVGRVYGPSASDFAADAVQLAAADAGLRLDELDGLLVSPGTRGRPTLSLQKQLGLRDLSLLSEIHALGASPAAMIAIAAQAIDAGTATAVACVFADAPLRPGGSSRDAFGGSVRRVPTGFSGLDVTLGAVTPNVFYAMAARRHMEAYGTTGEQFGAIAVGQRAWAGMNPAAQFTEPITLADHQASPMIADPFRLLDCCLVSNGGAAVIVTDAARARDLRQPPVHVLGAAQAHPGAAVRRDSQFGLVTGAAQAGPAAMRRAGVTAADVDLLELYDSYTYTVLVTLEDYGFCEMGQRGPFVADGHLAPGGALPCNTGGGQLSSYYLTAFTPIVEAVIQARGQAGRRQVDRREVIGVSGSGGVLEHHSTLVLSPNAPEGVTR